MVKPAMQIWEPFYDILSKSLKGEWGRRASEPRKRHVVLWLATSAANTVVPHVPLPGSNLSDVNFIATHVRSRQ
jgi:hypothetical protein